MWCHLPAIFSRRGTLIQTAVLSLFVAFITAAIFAHSASAAVGINKQINFQGRLLNGQGAVVPDGNYNIQFKLYQDGDSSGTGSTLKWTESYLNNNSQGVQIKNGYFAVQLGSIEAFGTSVDWNQDTLWLSMNVASTNPSCATFGACSPDGEMLPMRRLAATPYALNAGALNGLASSNFVQLSQGVQNDAANSTSSIFLNKTGTGGNFITLQDAGTDAFLVSRSGDIQFGGNANHTISVADAPSSTSGRDLTLTAGNAGAGGANGGNIVIDAGTGSTTNGTVAIGTTNASAITLGRASGGQTISIGEATSGTTNVTIGSSGTAAAGTTTLQAKDSISLNTNDVSRVTLTNTGSVYFGNGVSAAAPSNFTISGTGSTTTAVTGGSLTIQGGNATVGNADGGSLTLTGGTGVGTGAQGLVIISTPTYQLASGGTQTCENNDTTLDIAQPSVDGNGVISVASTSSASCVITLPDPTITTAGRIIYISAADTSSSDFTLSVNGGVGTGSLIAMRANTTATMVWNGLDWTAAGASSSTTLQSAYDNTLQSAGGAELVVSKTSATNGLTIRDSSTSPVNGSLLSVQSSSAANLFSVNSNVTEYASDAGAEIPLSTASPNSFPASTWTSIAGATVSRYNTAGGNIATGQASVSTVGSSAGDGVKNTLTATLTANNHYNVSFAARLASGTFTDMTVYYSIDGTAASAQCGTTNQTVSTSVWTKVNCSFTAPSSGINSGNAILIRQAGAGAHTYYIDNLSITIAADYSLVGDGGADAPGGIGDSGSTWDKATFGGSPTGTIAQDTNDGQAASTSVKYTSVPATAKVGIRNKLSINPLPNTLYRVTLYAKSSTSFNDFMVRYTPTSATANTSNDANYVDCKDYNTQSISTTSWTKVTCYIQTGATAPDTSYLYFVQTAGSARNIAVDTASLTLASATTPNVQIGGGSNGGPTTLFTLDRGASAPIAGDNEALLGSMYYDTSLGKLQCYEADGWGACGSSPDNIITISPEFTNAVMHGTGVGVMTSDLCSYTLGINDGQSGRPFICSTDETYNFYKWTSPQASDQSYSIYVTYQLPSTFKSFASGLTSLQARVDSTTNAYVKMQIYKNHPGSSLATCGGDVTITSSVDTWQAPPASGAADPSACGFVGGDSIVFKITMGSKANANAYVGNIGFTFSNN